MVAGTCSNGMTCSVVRLVVMDMVTDGGLRSQGPARME